MKAQGPAAEQKKSIRHKTRQGGVTREGDTEQQHCSNPPLSPAPRESPFALEE